MKRYLFLILFLLVACEKEVIPDPGAALLIDPGNNDTCNTAVVLSDQKSHHPRQSPQLPTCIQVQIQSQLLRIVHN